MASIMVRGLETELKRKLRIRAAENDRSMEEEARIILRTALNLPPVPPENLASAIRARFEPLGGVELDLPPRSPIRSLSRFD